MQKNSAMDVAGILKNKQVVGSTEWVTVIRLGRRLVLQAVKECEVDRWQGVSLKAFSPYL